MVDDFAAAEPKVRTEFRSAFDRELLAPLEEEAREEYERESWGLDAEAVDEARQTDAALADVTYEIPE